MMSAGGACVPHDVGGQIMAFVPGPERFCVRLACRSMATWPVDAVANVWLAPNAANRLRHPRRARPRAAEAVPLDGWWRSSVRVVHILSVSNDTWATRKRMASGSTTEAVDALFRDTRTGTALPSVDDASQRGWAWLRRLFPAVRVVELRSHQLLVPEPPLGVVLTHPYWREDTALGRPLRKWRKNTQLGRHQFLVAEDASPESVMGGLCGGVYPRQCPPWLQLHTDGAWSLAAVRDAAAAAGFAVAQAHAPGGDDGLEPVEIVAHCLDAHATYVTLGSTWLVKPPPGEAPAGTVMAAATLELGPAPYQHRLADVRRLVWPRLRTVCLIRPWASLTAANCRAVLRWALALPRLACLEIHDRSGPDTIVTLLAALDGRARPLGLKLRCDVCKGVLRLVAHPAVACVELSLSLSKSDAEQKILEQICAALADPAGPAALRSFRVIYDGDRQGGTVIPQATLRALVRGQPLLRYLNVAHA